MKTRLSLSALALACATLAGCQNLPQGDLMQHGMMAVKAATLSDAEVRQVADQACAESDQQNRIAPANSKYGQRLDKIAKALGDQIDGVPVNYKVYLTEEVNAWAMANGCIRVYSGLMELMSDNEIEGVLGHEMGHVALGHTRKAAQTAYAAPRRAARWPPCPAPSWANSPNRWSTRSSPSPRNPTPTISPTSY